MAHSTLLFDDDSDDSDDDDDAGGKFKVICMLGSCLNSRAGRQKQYRGPVYFGDKFQLSVKFTGSRSG